MLDLETILLFLAAQGGAASEAAVVKAVHELMPQEGDEEVGKFVPKDAVRALDMLGHIEYSSTSARPYINLAQPSLALAPLSESPTAFLCGARTPAFRKDLLESISSEFPKVRIQVSPLHFQRGTFTIERVAFSASTQDELLAISGRHRLPLSPIPAAWSLVNCGQDIDAFLRALTWSDTRLEGTHHRFDTEKLQFRMASFAGSSQSLTRIEAARTKIVSFYYEEPARIASIADLRLAKHALVSRDGHTWLRYDRRKLAFACPMRLPLPRYLARSLCLCSGSLPNHQVNHDGSMSWWVWSNVPAPIADAISTKMGQRYAPLPNFQ